MAEVSKIQDYAIIGNGRSAALISKNGSLDWLCWPRLDRKSTRLNSSHGYISYAVFCLKKKNIQQYNRLLRSLLVHAAPIASRYDSPLLPYSLHRCHQQPTGLARTPASCYLQVLLYSML